MEKSKISELILKYNEGVADPSELLAIEQLIEAGIISIDDLNDLEVLEKQIINSVSPSPSLTLDDRVYQMISDQKRKESRFTFAFKMPFLSFLLPRFAFTVAVLLCGFAGGYFFNKPSEPAEMQAVLKEVSTLKEMMMLSLLEKESASERLRAVSLTSEMDQASHKVTTALVQTLNNDQNVNVRLAALDALRPYVRDNNVRTELIKAIVRQESPLVQVALAELMRDIQEKRSVSEFDKILKGNKMPEEVKSRIKEKIQVLI